MKKSVRLVAAALLVAALGFACGVKAPPLPARLLLPNRISNLTHRFSEDGRLVVTFRPPARNVKGQALKDLGGFFVDRSENRLAPGFCPGCPVTYTKRFHIKALKPRGRRYVSEVTYQFEDLLTPGNVYHYRVFAYDSDKRFHSRKFMTLVVYYDSPCSAPDAIETETGDKLVVLRWPPPERLLDGRPASNLAGYNIYRQFGRDDWIRINSGKPWSRAVFEDTRVINGRAYKYKVRAVRNWRGTLIEGPPSPVILVTPADLTPPPPPVKVGVASLAKGVSLSWAEVAASDLAGYRVYRRKEKGAGFKKIGPKLIPETTFFDVKVKPGVIYFYRITAVDKSPAGNESEPSQEVRIQFQH